MLNLFLLGNPRLERNRKSIEFDTRKALALLAYLAVSRTSHSRDSLATLLYPEYDQTHARAALRRTLSALNTALSDDTLDINRETLALNPQTDLCVDVIEFERALAECKSHQHPASDVCNDCVPALTRAAELYRDDFLTGFSLRDSPNFDDWQFFTAENLRREFAGALEKLVRYHSAQKAYAPAIEYARRWLALDSLHEPAHRQLMQLYAASDQRAAALRQYHECARILEKELGVAPLAETTRLYEEIKEQKSRGAEEQERALRRISPLPPSPSAPQQYPLVGRAHELAQIKQIYADIRTDGHLIVIAGEAGIGKTRLAEEFLNHARERDAIILTGRAFEGEANLAHGIFVEALRALTERTDWRAKIPAAFIGEVARLVPEISTGETPPPLDNAGARGRFFEGISQSIFAITMGRHPSPRDTTPGILLLDDVQWADSASLDLLTYIVQRLRGRPLCLVVTWRTDAMHTAALEHLRQIVAHAHRTNTATTITLARLNSDAVMQLVTSSIGNSPAVAQKIGERLQRETEGLPFFVVEYLNALDTGNAELTDWSLPGGVRDLLRARLAVASETGKQLLSAAAVIGRAFDFDTLREASGRAEEETIKTLEELMAHGLIKEITAENLRYDFAHEKLRELAYAETSAARRRLLHRRTAEALRARRDSDALATQVARHYQLAGENLKAADYFKLAGDHARALYANAEALTHYRNALALGHSNPVGLHQAIGDLQTLTGDYAGALTSYATAASLCEPDALAAIEHKCGLVHHRRGEYDLAESHFQIALGALVENAPAAPHANLLADWSLTAHALGQAERAQEIASRALALSENAHDLRALARTRNILGILARSRGDLAQARYQLEHACALAESLNDPGMRIAGLNNLARVCRDAGEIERAIQLTATALSLCASMGDRHRQAALHNNLADLLHAVGKSDEAMTHLKQAVAIFADIGEAETMQPEIWKLVEW